MKEIIQSHVKQIHPLMKLFLLFVKPQSFWALNEGLVVKFKIFRGVTYILKQEPIQFGDARNRQIDRMESWL